MSYTPTTWSNGDTITSTKLNKMEQGIANAGNGYDLVIHANSLNPGSGTTFTLVSGTSADVWDKLDDGAYVRALLVGDGSSYTFPIVGTYDSYNIQQTSVEGCVLCRFYSHNQNATITLTVETDGTIIPD